MKLRKFVSAAMVVATSTTLMFGCGNSEETTKKDDTTKAGDTAAAGEDDTTAAEDDEEMAEINVAFMSMGSRDKSVTDPVVDAVNEITEKKINTHVNITWYDPNAFGTQVPMTIQAGEKLDLIMYTPVPSASFSSFMAQNQLADITEEIDSVGGDIKAAIGDLLPATSKDGKIYGTPTNRIIATDEYLYMRTDALEQVGALEDAKNLTTWTDFKSVLEKVKDGTSFAPICNNDGEGSVLTCQPYFNGSDKFADNYQYDSLGDGYNLIYADEATDKVKCFFESEEFKNQAQRTYDWYQAGLVYKDAATTQDQGQVLLKNGVAFSGLTSGEVGFQVQQSTNTGTDITAVKVVSGKITTGACTKFGFCVPTVATDKTAAVKFLNLIYSDSDLVNTLTWGLKDRDWVEKDGFASYPDGVTAENVAYHESDFLYCQPIAMAWTGDANKNVRQEQADAMANAERSKYLGFSVDETKVSSELTACVNVYKEYAPGLKAGSLEFPKAYDEYIKKLKAAGIDKVVAEYQSQLDAWLASNK